MAWSPSDLEFTVDNVQEASASATPLLQFQLRVAASSPAVRVQSLLLKCQIHLEATRRPYTTQEQKKLFDLFGKPPDWGRTLRSLLWTTVNLNVSEFVGSTVVELPVACQDDFQQASVKYFNSLDDGEIPLCFLFNGTVFYAGEQGNLQVGYVPWDKTAQYRMPLQVWRNLMDRYYPNSASFHLRKDVLERLLRYKSRQALPTLEHAIEKLLDSAESPSPVRHSLNWRYSTAATSDS